ncbi:MAG TPA: serine--tRNA ligase [Nitrososphaeraceae archaeon]|nr:serine--tRNA ligase [Nitrososphaeraceae archaeon]
MIDAKILKNDINRVNDMLQKRNIKFPLEELIEEDTKRRKLLIKLQFERHKKNNIAKIIATKKKDDQAIFSEIKLMDEIGDRIKLLEEEIATVDSKFKSYIRLLPNFFHESVPIGNSESDNIVVREYGTINKFSYNIKDHIDIGIELDLIDIERAAKISGARFYFLKNELVRLNQALISFALDFLHDKGYTLLQPPYMIRKNSMEGAVILGDFKDVIYKIEDEDLFMIGTSEHAMVSMHMNEILEGSKLPIRYAAISPCFRKEAGAHGKDMKGIFRVHHFEKVEQFVFSRPENSWEEHERMLRITEEFYKKLEIPYRVMLLCSSDLGKISAKTYDIEAWMPAQEKYREIVSCSNCTDYQARSLGIRFRDKTNEETKLVHTLNGTLVATQRTLVSLLENYQNSNGITIPDILQNYMGGTSIIKFKGQ